MRRLGHSQLREGDFPGGTVDKNLPAHPGDTGLIPGPGRCLGATKAYELQRLQKLQLLHPLALEPTLRSKGNQRSEKPSRHD